MSHVKLTVTEYVGFRLQNFSNESGDTWCGNCNATEYLAICDARLVMFNIASMFGVMVGGKSAFYMPMGTKRNWSDAASNWYRFVDNYNS